MGSKALLCSLILYLAVIVPATALYADVNPLEGRYKGRSGNGEWDFTVTNEVAFYRLKGALTGTRSDGTKHQFKINATYSPVTNEIITGKIKGVPGVHLAGHYDPENNLFRLQLMQGKQSHGTIVCRHKGYDITGTWFEDGVEFTITYLLKNVYKATWRVESAGSVWRGTLVGKFDGQTYSGRLTTSNGTTGTFGTFTMQFSPGPPAQLSGIFSWGNGELIYNHTLIKPYVDAS